jgi:hypothetical protein
MVTLKDYYEKHIANRQEEIIDSPFDDPRTEEEKAHESRSYTGCSFTCIHPNCPLWDAEHSRRLFSLN